MWRYLQYPSKAEAIEARRVHFTMKPSNACRLMRDGKITYTGEFGGPLPVKPSR